MQKVLHFCCWLRCVPWHIVAGDRGGEPKGSGGGRGGAPQKVLPIEIPAMQLDELNRLTDNFGQEALVGEGSYGRVFSATLSTGEQVAIKKLDTSTTSEPDSDFAAQVNQIYPFFNLLFDQCQILILLLFPIVQLSVVSRLKSDHFATLLGYCLEANNRILVYEFATLGSLHDVLHGVLMIIL